MIFGRKKKTAWLKINQVFPREVACSYCGIAMIALLDKETGRPYVNHITAVKRQDGWQCINEGKKLAAPLTELEEI